MSQLTYETYGDALLATFQGPVNRRTAPGYQEELAAAMEPVQNAVLDLTDVDDVSGSGVRLLLYVYHLAAVKGGETALVGLSEELRDTINATGLSEFFVVCKTLDEALMRIRRPEHRHIHARAHRAYRE